MSEAKKASLDLGAMMDKSLDAIQEAPDFAKPPPGEYRLKCTEAKIEKYTPKPSTSEPNPKEQQRLKLLYTMVTTYSVANSEQPVPDGSLLSETFMGTEEGLGYFKKQIRKIMNVEDIAGVTLGDMMNSVKEQEFDCRITIRKSAKPGTNPIEYYENIVIAPVQRAPSV